MICNRPKQIISVSGGLGLLQMVLEPDAGRCASKDANPQGGWIVRSHVGWRGEQNISYKDVETFP